MTFMMMKQHTLSLMCIMSTMMVVVVNAEENQCFTSLGDPESPFKSLGPMIVKLQNPLLNEDQILPAVPYTMNVLSYILQAVGAQYGVPTADFETCLASSDGLALVSNTLMGALSTCAPVAALTELQEVKTLLANLPSDPIDLPKVNDFMTFLLETEDEAYQNICKPLVGTVLPCIQVLVPSLMAQLKANACCDPLLSKLQAMLGTEPAVFVDQFVTKVLDLLCAIRTPGFNGNDEQTCSYTLLQTILLPEDLLGKVSSVFQALIIPDSQVCQAYAGEEFENADGNGLFNSADTTDGALGNSTEGIAIEGCANQMDAMVAFLATIPLLANDAMMSQVLTPGQCLKGTDLLSSSYGKFLSSLLPPGMFPYLQMFMSRGCFNFPTGFSCDFASTTVLPTAAKASFDPESIKIEKPGKNEPKNASATVMAPSSVYALLCSTFLVLILTM